MTLKVIKLIIKFCIHISQSPSTIVQAALSTNKVMAHSGYSSYYNYIQRLCKFCNIEHILYTSDANEIIYQLSKLDTNLKTLYIQKWETEQIQFQSHSKLDFFTQLKNNFEMSDYLLLIKNPLHRSAVTRVRLSAHKYPIETGRYQSVDREDRDCPLGCNALGGEEHYLLACPHPFISKIRKPIMERLKSLNTALANADNKSICQLILNNKDPLFLGLVGKLCYKIQEKFKDITI